MSAPQGLAPDPPRSRAFAREARQVWSGCRWGNYVSIDPVPDPVGGKTHPISRDRAQGLSAGIDPAAKVRIPSLTNTAAYRIPDELTATTLREVKNVRQIGLTAQIKDFIAYAQQTGRQVIIEVRENTVVSRELQAIADLPESPILLLRTLRAR